MVEIARDGGGRSRRESDRSDGRWVGRSDHKAAKSSIWAHRLFEPVTAARITVVSSSFVCTGGGGGAISIQTRTTASTPGPVVP